jgi:hypothetical protein
MKFAAACQIVFVLVFSPASRAQDDATDPELAKLQGTWIREVKDAQGNSVTITKEVKGKRETFLAKRGDEVLQKHEVEFEIEKTDHVRIFTYRNLTVTDGPNAGRVQEAPQSYIYRITDDEWICIHGAMADDEKPFSVEVFQRGKEEPPGDSTT